MRRTLRVVATVTLKSRELAFRQLCEATNRLCRFELTFGMCRTAPALVPGICSIFAERRRECAKVEVDVLGSPSRVVLMVYVDVKQHLKKYLCVRLQLMNGFAPSADSTASRFGLAAVRRYKAGTEAEGPRFDSDCALFSLQKLWFVDTVFVTLLLTINGT